LLAAMMYIVDSECEEDDELGLLLLLQAQVHQLHNHRYGTRRAYNSKRSTDFFDVLFNDASERIFKSWFRYVHRATHRQCLTPIHYRMSRFDVELVLLAADEFVICAVSVLETGVGCRGMC
jgi:hypothetical protein